MRSRLEDALKVVLLVVGAGLLVSVAAFVLTVATPGYRYLGPICVDDVARPGFDPWSGQPHGRIVDQYRCPPKPPSARRSHSHRVPTPELVGRTAVPCPSGSPWVASR